MKFMTKLLSKKTEGERLIEIVEKYHFIGTEGRKEKLLYVIRQESDCEEPLYFLAMAFANAHLGAKYRKKAICYFEKLLVAPIEYGYYDICSIYRTLGELYESEYDFKNAEKYYLLTKGLTKTTSMHLGKLYLKISTEKALEFWNEERKSKRYLNDADYKRLVDIEYNNVLDKQKKGYVYKARKKTNI